MQARIAAEMTVLNPVGPRLLLPVGRVGACQTEVAKLMLRL